MKGVILAGGLGTRLLPCTKVVNKNCLPLYDQPVIYYSIKTLVSAGIKEILIITGGKYPDNILEVVGDGKEFGVEKIAYAYQKEPKGVADALKSAEKFAEKDKIVLIFADNIFEDSIKKDVEIFEKQKYGARLFFKKVSDPRRFGVAEIKKGKIVNIEEKPQKPKSRLAEVGLYMYNNQVFDVLKTLKPSARGEYEITDVNNFYVQKDIVTFRELKGFWSDVGTFESLFKTACHIAKTKKSKL
jgi:glucose-1-phosphate thymidylyltransferase